MIADAAVIAILIDESLATLIDENPIDQRFGRIKRQAQEGLAHVDRRAPHAHPQEDARAIVARGSDGIVGAQQMRHVAFDHIAIHHEAAGTQDDAVAGPGKTDLASDPNHHAMDMIGLIGNQGEHPAVIANLHAERFDARGQCVHQHAPAAPAGPLRRVSARARLGVLHERPCLFTAGPDQAVVCHWL
ncbi:hypothetical protein D3C84_701030 [compost metagenome]